MLSGETKCKNSAKDIYDQIVEWKWHNSKLWWWKKLDSKCEYMSIIVFNEVI
jgi:hypothetical protein